MKKIVTILKLVKFEHTIFALPFAYMGALLAEGGVPPLKFWLWITLAMAGARTAAMAVNRLLDLKYDRENPRTKKWPLVTGEISVKAVWVLTVVSLAVLFTAAAQLNMLCLMLSPVAVLLLFFYSFTKRFTWLCHVFLGLVLSCAPLGGWIAVRGSINIEGVLLGLAVLCWLPGFDVIYAIQDVEFDQTHGLYSIPSRLGIPAALAVSALFHTGTVVFLVLAGLALKLKFWYWIGTGLAGALLAYEHWLVRPNDLSKVNKAFFDVNGWVSVSMFVFTLLEVTRG